jgi:hypothetical protein
MTDQIVFSRNLSGQESALDAIVSFLLFRCTELAGD